MMPEITVRLTGRVGTWHPRNVCGRAQSVWAAWLRTEHYGLIGVYVLAKPEAQLAEALPNATAITVRAQLWPTRIQALGDDPRAADDTASTPLLLHAHQVVRASRADLKALLWRDIGTVQVRGGRWTSAGYLAPAAHLPDVLHIAPDERPAGAVRTWSTLRGVVAQIGMYRYIRYVLAETHV
jgi:hypothetical protein